MMRTLFGPGLKLIGMVGPVSRAVMIVALFSVPVFAAGRLGAHERELVPYVWAIFLVPAYLVCALILWGQLGMQRIARTVERIALGDLTARAHGGGVDGRDAEQMWKSISAMSGNLAGIVNQVNASCEAIVESAREIADGYANLSQRTEEQASTLEETASGMEELSGTVKQNADSCRRAEELATKASAIAAAAAESMHRVTGTMAKIETSSKRVGEIIGVIESIAFQTNILALNAAVEAARAGEQGRGFAVVASEVRSLAQRSADAAKEIKALIGAAVGAVSEGARQVDAAAETIGQAAASVHSVTGVIGEIANASGEQSAGVDEINKAIVQLEQVTQQNAALVEQAAAAALSFEEEAGRLSNAVGAFKIDRREARNAAVELVKKGVEHLRVRGRQAAFADFETRGGEFINGDYYLWACDLEGIVRCNGSNPRSRNQDHAGLKDANGKLFIREVLRIAREQGKGWVDYYWRNPVSKVVEPKSTYFERADGLILLCGIYRTGKAEQVVEALPEPGRRVSLAAPR
jgi:methyl-accepting chemotaxis protein